MISDSHRVKMGRRPALRAFACLLLAFAPAVPLHSQTVTDYAIEIRFVGGEYAHEFFSNTLFYRGRLSGGDSPLPPPGSLTDEGREKLDGLLLKAILDDLERRKAEARKSQTGLIVAGQPKKPKAPPRRPKKKMPPLDPKFYEELLKRLRGAKDIPVIDGGGIKTGQQSFGTGPNVRLPAPGGWVYQPRPPGGTGGGGGILIDDRDAGAPILHKIPYISRLFKDKEVGRETPGILILINPRIILEDEGDDGDEGAQTRFTATGGGASPPPSVPPPPQPPGTVAGDDAGRLEQAVIFPEDGDEWFATLGAGLHMARFDIELRPSPLLGQLGKLPASATSLTFTGSRNWRLQPANQRPRTRVRADDGALIIDPRSDFERDSSEYAAFLNALRQNDGLRGFESDAIRNFALEQNVSGSERRQGFDEESFYGSVMFGYRRGCCSFPGSDGRLYWQGGLAFSWMDEVSLSTPYAPAWSNDITVNYNHALNSQRSSLARQLQPISRISLLGYQSADLEMDAQALALFFGAGCKFPCGCRLSLNLMAGYTFQQWELMERQRITANGKRILDAERRSSGDDAVPTLSGVIEAAYPITENTEIVLYGGTTLSMSNSGRIDTDTLRFGWDTSASGARFFGLGMSVRF